jgi:peptide/nickel transport system ATP-binding protein
VSAPSGEPALVVDRLSIGYGEGPDAVSGVSLQVNRSEIVGVIGESGSGKSSVALALLGLLPESARITAGALTIGGADTLSFSEADWCGIRGRSVSMIFQEPMTALNPCQRIGRQIEEVLLIHGLADRFTARERAIALLELVEMPEPQKRVRYFPHQLSGGQRQRVVIAIAMAADPALLVADEPTTALDVTVQAQVLTLIRDLRDRTGMGVLFISHDLGVIGQLCDRVVVMYRGRVVETGTSAEVLRAPRHPYTRALLESIPRPSIRPREPLQVIAADADFAGAAVELDGAPLDGALR